jgi:hypothetical protein
MTLMGRVTALLGLLGCAGGEADTDLAPPPLAARYVADAVLRDCTWSGERWYGVRQLALTLEHDLDGLDLRELPPPGACTEGVELYAEEAFIEGDPLPDGADRPRWSGPPGGGVLPEVLPGLWHATAFTAPERCGTLEQTVGGGFSLDEAGPFTGIATPPSLTLPEATADGVRFGDRDPVSVGESVDLAWEADGVDVAFVQIRRLHEGQIRQTITCTPSEPGRFTLDDTAWDLADDGILAGQTAVRLGLSRRVEQTLDDGSARVLVRTRALLDLGP